MKNNCRNCGAPLINAHNCIYCGTIYSFVKNNTIIDECTRKAAQEILKCYVTKEQLHDIISSTDINVNEIITNHLKF